MELGFFNKYTILYCENKYNLYKNFVLLGSNR